MKRTFFHHRLVNGVRWSHDGARLASASADKSCRLWDPHLGGLQMVLRRHADDVNSVAWSLDDTRVLTVSEDATGRLWDVERGILLDAVLPHRNTCLAIDCNPATGVVVTCGEDRAAKLWDFSGTFLGEWEHPSDMESCRWSHTGTMLATACDDGFARILDSEGQCVACLGPHAAPVKSVSWSPDDSRLAVGTYDSRCTIWDIDRAEAIGAFHSPRLWPRALHWNPHDEHIAVGTFDGAPAIIAADDLPRDRGRMVSVPSGPPTFGINSTSVIADRGLLLGCDDGRLRMWELAQDGRITTLPLDLPTRSLVNSVSSRSDGTRAIVSAGTFDGFVHLFDLDSGALLGSAHIGVPVNQAAWSPSGHQLVVADYVGRLSVFTVSADGQPERERIIEVHEGAIKSAQWLDETAILSGSTDRLVKITSASGEVLQVLAGHHELVNWVDATIAGGRTLIASVARDHTVRIWDAHSGRCERVLVGHDESVKVVKWRPGSGSLLASGSYDFDVRLWNLDINDGEGDTAVVLRAHRNGISALAWWRDQLVSASWDTALILWDLGDLSAPSIARQVVLGELIR